MFSPTRTTPSTDTRYFVKVYFSTFGLFGKEINCSKTEDSFAKRPWMRPETELWWGGAGLKG